MTSVKRVSPSAPAHQCQSWNSSLGDSNTPTPSGAPRHPPTGLHCREKSWVTALGPMVGPNQGGCLEGESQEACEWPQGKSERGQQQALRGVAKWFGLAVRRD